MKKIFILLALSIANSAINACTFTFKNDGNNPIFIGGGYDGKYILPGKTEKVIGSIELPELRVYVFDKNIHDKNNYVVRYLLKENKCSDKDEHFNFRDLDGLSASTTIETPIQVIKVSSHEKQD